MPAVLQGNDLRVEDKLDSLRRQIHDHQFAVADEIRQFVNRYVTIHPDEAQARIGQTVTELVGSVCAELGLPSASHAGVVPVVASHVRDLVMGRAQASEDSARWAVHHAANQVTMYSGQFVYDAEDIFIDGAGLDFLFRRTYKSQGFNNGPLGANWDHNYQLALRVLDGGQKIVRITGNFQESQYVWSAQHGYWFPPPGEHTVVFASPAPPGVADVALPPGPPADYLLRLPNGTLHVYTQDPGQPTHFVISAIVDRHGNALVFEYEQAVSGIDRLKTVRINCPYRYAVFDYDTQDRIVAIHDHVGREWLYDYDDAGDLVAVTVPGGDRYPQGLRERYVYSTANTTGELQHKLLQVYDTASRLHLENAYGGDAGVLSFGRVIRQREGQGERFFEYQDVSLATGTPAGDRALEEDMPACQTILIRRNGHPVHYIYNKFGNLIAREEDAWAGGAARHLVSHYRYNRDGGLVGECSPEGRVSQSLYGRDEFLRQYQVEDLTEDELREHAMLTWQTRLSFGNRLARIQRGQKAGFLTAFEYPSPLTLPQLGLGKVDKLHDVIVKFEYERKYQHLVSISHPQYTRSPFAGAAIDANPRFKATLTTFSYDPATGKRLKKIRYPDCSSPKGPPVVDIAEHFLGYDPRGRLTLYEDQGGVRLALAYYPPPPPQVAPDPSEAAKEGYQRTRTMDPGGLNLVTTYEVNAAGAVTKMTTPKQQVIDLAVDNLNRVTKITRTLPARVSMDLVTHQLVQKPQVSYETRYTYCRNMRIEQVERDVCDDEGRPLWGGPEVQFFHYDENDNMVRRQIGSRSFADHLITHYAYDDGDLRIGTTLPRGNRVRVEYDERRLPQQITRGFGTPEAAAAELAYDGDGLLGQERDGRGLKTELVYDPFGRVVESRDFDEHDALYRLIRQDYDKSGNLLIERLFVPELPGTYRLLYHASYRYDVLNRCIESRVRRIHDPIASSQADIDAADTVVPSAGAVRTLYFYDRGGRLIRVERRGRRLTKQGMPRAAETVLATTYEYNALGWPAAEIDALGNRTEMHYDAHGLLTRADVREQVGHTYSPTGEEVFTTLYTYDALDRLESTTDSLGNMTHLEYDSRDALIRRIDPLSNVTSYEYDIYGRRTVECIAMTDTGLGGSQPEWDIVTQFDWDANGNMTRVTNAKGTTTDENYDALDRRSWLGFADGTGMRYSYDGNDNQIWIQDNNGLIRRMAYDPLDKLVCVEVDRQGLAPGLVVGGVTRETYAYNALGQMTYARAEEAAGGWSCELGLKTDSLGHVWEESTKFSDVPQVFRLRRQHDDFGFIRRLIYPNGRVILYEPDALNRISVIRNLDESAHYPGQANQQPQRVVLKTEYCGLRIGRHVYGNGAQVSYGYDNAGRVISITHENAQNTRLLALQQLFDAAGNLRVRYEYVPHGQQPYGEVYHYDSRYQLTHYETVIPPQPLNLATLSPRHAVLLNPAQLTGQSQINALLGNLAQTPGVWTWRYDKLGNRVEERPLNQPPILYATNPLNQYTRRNGTQYSYDPNGNVCHVQQGLQSCDYIYNYRNQLVRAMESGQTTDFHYDALGRRVGVMRDGVVLFLVYADDDVAEEWRRPAGQSLIQLAAQYVNGAEVDNCSHLAAGGHDYWYHKDLLGSTRLLTDETGGQAVTGNNQPVQYSYRPFGELTAPSPDLPNPYLFGGHRFDAMPEMYYLRRREYCPETGRFLQRDPLDLAQGPNPYLYVGNNPLTHSDSTGYEPDDEITGHHATGGQRSQRNLRGRGFTAAYSSSSSFLRGDWLLDTPNIPKSIAAKGQVVLQQRISTRGLVEITNPNLLDVLRGICGSGEGAKEMRASVRSAAREAAVGRAPLTGETDLQAYLREQIIRAHPDAAEAPVIRWKNPDGTYTYVVRNKSAYVGRPELSPPSEQSVKGTSMPRMRAGGKVGLATVVGGGILLVANIASAAEYISEGRTSSERMDHAFDTAANIGFWAMLGSVLGGAATSLLGLTQLSGENPNQIERDARAQWEAFLEQQERYQRALSDPPPGLTHWGIPSVGNTLDIFKYRRP